MDAVVVVGLFAAQALLVQKVVSFIRRAFDGGNRLPTWSWNVVAFAVGVVYCLGFQINLSAAAAGLVPALADAAPLSDTTGQILTGLTIGAFAGFWYGVLQALEATVHRNSPTP